MTRTRRFLGTLLVAAVLTALLPTLPAEAGSRYLCTSYVGCKDDGYPHFGYKKAGQRMWWRMYAGHNCTNYVAYRLVRGGMSAERPWSGTGMAWNWGRANPRKTDQRPMVGSVAWWKRNAPGAGSSGHVAYVEKVISKRKIVVSEDSWSGDFHWRRITKGGRGWPTGFIHFDDRRVEVRERPAVSGTVAVGETLTASAGRWAPAASYDFQWLADGKPIPGATTARLTPGPELRRARLAVRVTASERGYVDGRAASPRTVRVARGTMAVTGQPIITGRPRVGETLQLDRGSWSPAPDTVSIRWFAAGEPIRGADGPRLRLEPRMVGQRITVRTTARKEGYRTSAVTAEPTTEVEPGRFEISSPFTLEGTARFGRSLGVAPGTFQPADARVEHQWLRNGRPIEGATGRTLDLGADDVGKQISVRVRLRHDGYRDRTVVLETDGRVTTTPDLQVRTEGKPGRAVVRVRVAAPGMATPGGRVTVRIDGHEVGGRLTDGRVRLVVGDLPRGTHRVKVAYEGTEVVLPGDATATVKVLRRGD